MTIPNHTMPVRFGSENPQLLGMFHPAQVQAASAWGVLICNPFGQEAIRSHRMFKLLAERLAREGVNVLRFDYFATGDSPGDDAQIDCDRWREDIAAAHNELSRRTLPGHITWIGVRLGATLAALTSANVQKQPHRLILWEPIVDGSDYLRQLAAGHVRHLVATLGHAGGAVESGESEALGFSLPPKWRRQVDTITIDSLASAHADETVIVAPAALLQTLNAHFGRWQNAGRVDTHPFEALIDWNSEEALSSALVPAPAIALLCSLAVTAR